MPSRLSDIVGSEYLCSTSLTGLPTPQRIPPTQSARLGGWLRSMANNNFFNSTHDDFFEDLSNYSLPAPSWNPMSGFPPFNGHLGTLEPPVFSSAGSRSLSTAASLPPPRPPAFFSGSALRPGDLGNGPGSAFTASRPGPTFFYPGASHPPTPTFEHLIIPPAMDLNSRRLNQSANPPRNADQPSLSLPPLLINPYMSRNATPPQREPNSDDFLNELVSRDFSSPSIPSQTPHRLISNALNRLPPINPPSAPQSNFTTGLRPNYRRVTSGLRIPPVARRASAQAGETSESDSSSNSADSDIPDMSSQARTARAKRSTRTSQGLTLPASSGSSSRTINGLQPTQPTRSQRTRSSAAPSSSAFPGKRKREDSEDLFGGDDIEVVDLVDKEEVPEEIRNQKPKEYIRLGSFQCVICMDDVADLTVTYCGHLFCAECLHSALNIDPTKRVCPICRQKIDNKPSNAKFTTKAKGYFPLELKLMTKRNLRKSTG